MTNYVDKEELGNKCDFDLCHCVPVVETAVVEEKSVFCSEGCRSGTGCSCDPCNCAHAK